MDWSLQQRVEVDAPSHLQLPTGSTVPIDYSGAQPRACVKLQEVFGLADTPLLGGRGVGVPLLLELLSPAGRPLQVCARGAGRGCWEDGPGQWGRESRVHMHACLSQHRSYSMATVSTTNRAAAVLLCPWLTHARTHIQPQVTANLATFWSDAYGQVKKEMKGRYPRHPWPDDPATATPTRLTNKQLAAAAGSDGSSSGGSKAGPAKLQAVNKKKRK